MSGLVLREPRTEQPPFLARPDPDSLMLAGVSSSLIAYGPPENWVVNVGERIGNPTFNGTFSAGGTPIGVGTRFNGTNTYFSYDSANVPADEFTFLIGIVFDSLSGVTGLIDASNGSSNGWSLFTSGTDMYLSGNHYSGDLLASGWTTGVFYHIAARNKFGIGKAIFRNGSIIAADTTSLIGVSNPTSPMWIGRLKVSGPQYISGRVAYCYLIDKYLTHAAIASIASNAWQALEPEETPIHFSIGGAPAPSFKPVWARNSNAVISGAIR